MAQESTKDRNGYLDMAGGENVDSGGQENRNSGFCECGCGRLLRGAGRGRRQRWATDACRKRAAGRDRRRRLASARQMVDLGRTPAERLGTFLAIVRDLAPRLAMDAPAARRRLEELTPDRVDLAVPAEEFEAARRNSLRCMSSCDSPQGAR